MRQIIPFKKELLFKTKISEITSISLEHTLRLVEDNFVSGEFHISGDYKMTEASINREKFYFTLPFEINLDDDYISDSVSIDIDNFYYEVVNDDSLQVNIDVFVDGEKKKVLDDNSIIESDVSNETLDEIVDSSCAICRDVNLENLESVSEDGEVNIDKEVDSNDNNNISNNIIDISSSNNSTMEEENINNYDIDNSFSNIDTNRDNIDKTIDYMEVPKVSFSNIQSSSVDDVIPSNNFNFFNTENFGTDTYVTYYVYIVKEDDTIDGIMDKFNVSKEDIANYNDISDIKKGTKLIIPTSNTNE